MKKTEILLFNIIIILVLAGVSLNLKEQYQKDQTKLPEKIESNNGFQRWITNIKNKGYEVSADEFELKEENEIYNSKWIKVYSLDDNNIKILFDEKLESLRDTKKVVYSPSDELYIDFRNFPRDGYSENEAIFYGRLDDKLIDARIVDCSLKANCYFDRAYFLENDVFVISELSRNLEEDAEIIQECLKDALCEYTFKIHLIDLKNNKRLVYESQGFEAVFNEIMPEL